MATTKFEFDNKGLFLKDIWHWLHMCLDKCVFVYLYNCIMTRHLTLVTRVPWQIARVSVNCFVLLHLPTSSASRLFYIFLFFQMMQRQKANKLFSHPGHKIPKMFKLCFVGCATRSCWFTFNFLINVFVILETRTLGKMRLSVPLLCLRNGWREQFLLFLLWKCWFEVGGGLVSQRWDLLW